ncbi:MAG TPA: hypothetical protein VNB91_04440 [Jatrophihabitantaceae bacterium]|jgi:hypothetical protein|nr:hypothetical protein [Jatrophihabitantaceae bacterium]
MLGARHVAESADRLRHCKALLVLIGPDRESTVDDDSMRLANPADHMHTHIRTAIDTGATVVPVVVGLRRVLRPGDLPAELRDLAYRKQLTLRADPSPNDLATLVQELINDVPALVTAALKARGRR